MITWGGRLLVLLGAGHLLTGLAITSPHFARTWLAGHLTDDSLTALSPANGAYWLTVGSFAFPLIILGLLILWLDRRDIVPPLFLPWTIGLWSLAAAAMFRGIPWLLAWLGVALLFTGIHRARTAGAGRMERADIVR
ncbi:hypothetical protein GPX89_24670 [Nocardia sp. ET3-3]|uniref:Uncharacterized protein n=1 Tax=Nocardia terrae TaxID=2675851 RepID=A0A7K1V1B0_9NOCA|nr:DUF6463 family protein [Nocardia terrae]MVU80430.1 hypothetical protein [Nocardia terrae]